MHLAIKKCICYNAGRQKDKEYFHCGTMNEPPDVLVVHPGFFLEILYLYFRYFLKIVNNKIEEISSVDKSAETQENASCNPKLHML